MEKLIDRFRESISLPVGKLLPSKSPIQGILLNGSVSVTRMATYLNENGFFVKAICFPTVPKGLERVRICLHVHNTVTEVDNLVKSIHDFVSIYLKTKL